MLVQPVINYKNSPFDRMKHSILTYRGVLGKLQFYVPGSALKCNPACTDSCLGEIINPNVVWMVFGTNKFFVPMTSIKHLISYMRFLDLLVHFFG